MGILHVCVWMCVCVCVCVCVRARACAKLLYLFRLFATLWSVARQAPLSMGFSRQEYWSGLPCPPPGDLPNPGIEPESLMSPALAGGFFTTSTTWEARGHADQILNCLSCNTLENEKEVLLTIVPRWQVSIITGPRKLGHIITQPIG